MNIKNTLTAIIGCYLISMVISLMASDYILALIIFGFAIVLYNIRKYIIENIKEKEPVYNIYKLHQMYELYARTRSESVTTGGFLEWLHVNDYVINKK